MKISKITLEYYQFKKIPKIGNFKTKFGWSIHEVINRQSNFKTDTKHYNDINYLKLVYGNYKRGLISRYEFKHKVKSRNYINRYLKHFL